MVQIQKAKRSDVFKVDPRALVVEEGFNIRIDYGNIAELASSIAERGVMVPLRGYRKKEDGNELFVIVDGHRRYKAIMMALENGAEISRVPMILEGKGYSKEERVLDMFTLNDGKRLEPMEEGELFKRLKAFGWAEKEISKKTGRSLPHVYKMIEVANAPMEIKNQIKEGNISANTVSQIMTETKNEEEQKEIVSSAVKTAKSEGKKATAKHVKNGKKAPIPATLEALGMIEEKSEKAKIVEAFVMLLKKKPTPEEIKEFLEG